MIRALLTALVLLVPVAAAAAQSGSIFPVTDGPPLPRGKPVLRLPPSGQPLLRATMIAVHNQARRDFGAAPLRWDDQLARDAAAYANALARSNRFEHDQQIGRLPRQGENLWTGTRGAFSYAAMIRPLIDERRFFISGRFPAVSRTGQWSDVGHYTQIVWPGTQQVGCATAANRSSDYLVCRYLPAGNVIGVELR